jgi:hypothetical protein
MRTKKLIEKGMFVRIDNHAERSLEEFGKNDEKKKYLGKVVEVSDISPSNPDRIQIKRTELIAPLDNRWVRPFWSFHIDDVTILEINRKNMEPKKFDTNNLVL